MKKALKEINRQSVHWFRLWMPRERETVHMGREIFICALLGVLVGLAAVGFYYLIDIVRVYAFESFAGFKVAQAAGEPEVFQKVGLFTWWHEALCNIHPWFCRIVTWIVRVLLPGLGAFLAAWIAWKFSPSASGHGTDTVIAAYHHDATDIPASVIPVKAITSALVIGTGGSAGSEGPVTQIGAACGALIGRRLGLSPYERRIMMAAGMAAGIGALFRSPMAGALFAAEIFYRGFDFEGEVLIPSMVASAIAYVTFASFIGWQPLFETPTYVFNSPMRIIPFAVLAIFVTLGVRMFIMIFRQTEIIVRRSQIFVLYRPLLGGLATGLLGLFFPKILGAGYGVIQEMMQPNSDVLAIGGQLLPLVFLGLALAKMFATAFSVGSGGSGGLLGPSLFCGALIGASVGTTFTLATPTFDIHISNFAMVGMAGFLAGAVRTPLAAILMVSEFTGNHELLLPAMLVCGCSFLLTPGWTLYKSQVRDRDSSPVHQGKHIAATVSYAPSEHGPKKASRRRGRK